MTDKKEWCPSSNTSWYHGNSYGGFSPLWVRIVVRVLTDGREIVAAGVICPGCGRELKLLKHPGSPLRFVIIPRHYRR
jgi:hypothetical protein